MPREAPVTRTPRPVTGRAVEPIEGCEPSWRSVREVPRVASPAGGPEDVSDPESGSSRVAEPKPTQARAEEIESARESFPRQSARTRRFSLGQPRAFAVARDGSR